MMKNYVEESTKEDDQRFIKYILSLVKDEIENDLPPGVNPSDMEGEDFVYTQSNEV